MGMRTEAAPALVHLNPGDGGARPAPAAPAAVRLLTADEVAEILGVPRTFVYALARRGDMPSVHLGERYVRFRREAVYEWIAANESSGRVGSR
jgi:excisionase family DNA binding protein